MEQAKTTSWGWIIFWLIIFWPVGLYLVVKKLDIDKSALMSNKTRILTVIGWVLIFVGFVGTVSILGEEGDIGSLTVGLILIVGGVLLLVRSLKIKKLAIKYKKYINIVVNQDVRSIDDIASAVDRPYDDVVEDLQHMINIGYLNDAYIHKGKREIILKQVSAHSANQEGSVFQSQEQGKVVRCSGCGANNVVTIGKVSECEYCATAITG